MGDAAYDAWAEKAMAHIEKIRRDQEAVAPITADDLGPWRLSAEEIAWVKERYTAIIPSNMALDAVEQAAQDTANRFPDNHTPKRLLMDAVISGPSVFENVHPT